MRASEAEERRQAELAEAAHRAKLARQEARFAKADRTRAEAEAIRRYTTGESKALFFDDFQNAPPPIRRPGWTAHGSLGSGGSGVMPLDAGMKMLAGDTEWTDYVIEAVVMLRSEEQGNAGLVFRANDPGPGHDELAEAIITDPHLLHQEVGAAVDGALGFLELPDVPEGDHDVRVDP